MKTFKQFIAEQETFNLEEFKEDCSFILSKLRGGGLENLLYRGMKGPRPDFVFATWTDRERPLHTRVEYHDLFNDFFIDKFGAPARNWMFATGNRDTAEMYANPSLCVIFPIGQFDWICAQDSKLQDLYTLSSGIESNVTLDDSIPESKERKEILARLRIELEKAKWWHNTNLQDCIESGNEIMIKCKHYYSFNVSGDVWNSPELQNFLKQL